MKTINTIQPQNVHGQTVISNTPLSNYPDVLTVDELRQILRISRTAAYQLLRDNQISYRKIGRIYRISKHSLQEYINSFDI